MRYLLLTLLFPLTVFAGQADFDAGNAALASKDYNTAKQHFLKCANRWTGCMTQMGVANFYQGNRDEAVAWFNLAAKYGDETAIGNLNKLGQPAPQRIQTQQQADDLGAIDLINAILSGYNKAGRNHMHCDSIMTPDGIIDTDCK